MIKRILLLAVIAFGAMGASCQQTTSAPPPGSYTMPSK